MPMGLNLGMGLASVEGGRMNVVPGDGPDNGMNGANFFLSGSEVAPTTFFSSGYDSQYHTANGIEVPEATDYAPQLNAEIVPLFEQPHTVVLDGTVTDGRVYLLTDNAVYFEVDINAGFAGYNDGSDSAGTTLTAGRHKFAWTHTDGGVLLSIDGGAVIPYPDADPLGDITGPVILGIHQGGVCSEFTIYTTPVTDESALQALSALS